MANTRELGATPCLRSVLSSVLRPQIAVSKGSLHSRRTEGFSPAPAPPLCPLKGGEA